MIRSKSRSGSSSEFGKKRNKSAFLRTLSASRFCRGDPLVSEIDGNALKPVEREPLKRLDISEKQAVDITNMQQHIGQMEEELKNVKQQLNVTRNEKDRTLEELQETKLAARETNSKTTETVPSPMIGEVLKMKEKEIKSLKLELKKAKGLEIEKEAKIRVQELEDELERVKLSERKMYATMASQMKQLEATKVELKDSKLEVASLREAIAKLVALHREKYSGRLEGANNHDNGDGGPNKMYEQFNSLKGELKLAIEAEEKSNKAMEDLALALKEVATEANRTKEELASKEEELGHVKDEAEQLKEMVRTIEDKYKNQLEDASKEIERYKNTVERLNLEAEESLLAWNDKEVGFVSCIKKAEEDNVQLAKSLKQAENLTKTSREENYKLRDIMKQALNEANVAKEAANLARIENSHLKDTQSKKDEALDNLAQENERLSESVKELKRLLSLPLKREKVEKTPTVGNNENVQKIVDDFRLSNLGEVKISNGHRIMDEEVLHEDPEKADALRGSIFDNVLSPISEPHTPQHKRVPSPFEEKLCSEDMDRNVVSDFNGEGERKGKALFRRFGELMKRKNLN